MKEDESIVPIKHISSWSDLESFLAKKTYRKWIFRGQSDSGWPLDSSYRRYVQAVNPIVRPTSNNLKLINRIEQLMYDRFKEHAHLYLQNLPNWDDDVEWLSLMQHHGTPTRMVDWSFSPYIALFFAVESAESDFALYCLNHHEMKEADEVHFHLEENEDLSKLKKNIFIDRRNDKSFIYAYEPRYKHGRLIAQQGLFTIPSTNYQSYEEILKEYANIDDILVKLIFPKRMLRNIVRKLTAMNINAGTLFPGLDGFCRSVKHQIFQNMNLTQQIS